MRSVTGISDLFVHRYRFIPAPFSNICPSCMGDEEDEIHFLLYCPATIDLRVKYLLPIGQVDAVDPLSEVLFK